MKSLNFNLAAGTVTIDESCISITERIASLDDNGSNAV